MENYTTKRSYFHQKTTSLHPWRRFGPRLRQRMSTPQSQHDEFELRELMHGRIKMMTAMCFAWACSCQSMYSRRQHRVPRPANFRGPRRHGWCTVASSNSHFLGVFLDPLLVMSTHTLKQPPLLPTTQPKPTVSLSFLEVYFYERCHPCRCSRQEFSIQNTLPEFRCVELRQPHKCKRRTTYFFCYTHHVYSQGGPFFVLLVSFVALFCGRSFFKLSRSRPFSCNVLSWLAPTATFVPTAGGRYGSSTPIPHPFKSSEFVRATGRGPHPQRRRRRTANLANPRSLSESATPGAV